MNKDEIIALIRAAKNPVYLTGAGVSTLSGIPDYRSMNGIYSQGPEYLLSRECMLEETDKFYEFVKQIYHPEAEPNVAHFKMAPHKIVTQNIDGLFEKAGAHDLVEFHGTLYECHCEKCGADVDYHEFLGTYTHENCGGIVRPNIVLYQEQINPDNIERAIQYIAYADLVIVVGTSLKVYPFAGLIQYANAPIIVIDKNEIYGPQTHSYVGDMRDIFTEL
ncbi:MAG: NAD-dependent protein deacylase [Lactobacillales bacterium]|nr:NAD-dependent protein deacylase [Lactobacillales bacterium]